MSVLFRRGASVTASSSGADRRSSGGQRDGTSADPTPDARHAPTPKRRVLCIVGTRPEAIKMAPVVRALEEAGSRCDVRLCVTAQHRDLLDPVLALFGLTPTYDLDVMRPGQTLGALSSSLFHALDTVVADARPDWVLVQGDTTSAMVGAMSAFYQRVAVAHVEAGLRTGDMGRPFPEEMNRTVIARMAALHFAPTSRARENLLAEGIPDDRVLVTGNTAIDALRWALDRPASVSDVIGPAHGLRRILVTLHRREHFGEPINVMARALRDVAIAVPDIQLICPVHPNPQVGPVLRAVLGALPNAVLTPPLDYLTTVHLMREASVVVTDSGGIQEEAPSLGKPVVVLRDTTERPEGIEAGGAVLAGTTHEGIVSTLTRLLTDDVSYARMAQAISPYGDGHAARRIRQALEERMPVSPVDASESPLLPTGAGTPASVGH